MSKLPKGFTCRCGRYEEFSVYVYAHWNEELKFTCEKCGRVYAVYAGQARLTYTPDELIGEDSLSV
jgi:transcription elongation factor Elf1